MKLADLIPFLCFSSVIEPKKIEWQFNHCHQDNLSRFPYWSISASRRKLINLFWYENVLYHFTALNAIAFLVTIIFCNNNLFKPAEFFIMGFIFCFLFATITIFIYLPAFQNLYMPLLDSYLELYSGKQQDGIQKCKKEQYPVMTLMLIQYCYHKLSGMDSSSLMATEQQGLLIKQYGVSQKMIDVTLRTIILNKWDASKIRKRTEIRQAFEEAMKYFRILECDDAVQLLNKLQFKIENQS